MPTIITTEGRRNVPDDENIILKVSGWVKYKKNGKIHHIPPHMIKEIEESDTASDGGEIQPGRNRSNVVYQSPYGKV